MARRLVEEGAAVVDVNADAPALVGMVRVVERSEVLNHGVDLDGVDVPGVHRQGDGDVVAVAGADDQYVSERTVVDVAVRVEVERLDSAELRDRVRILMRDVIHPDQERTP